MENLLRERIKESISQLTTGILGVIVAALASMKFPEPFRSLTLLAIAIWLSIAYWISQRPRTGEILERIKYLDALHDHNPKLMSDNEYFFRMNRLIVLDAVSSKFPMQRRFKDKLDSPDVETPGETKEGKKGLFVSLCCMAGAFLLPAIYGVATALGGAQVLPGWLNAAVQTNAFRIMLIGLALYSDYSLAERVSSFALGDLLTFIFTGVFFWSVGYLAAALHFGSIRPGLLFASFSLSLYGLTIAGYLDSRNLIERDVRRRLEFLSMGLGVSFYYAGVYFASYIIAGSIDLNNQVSLLLVGLMVTTGIACLWLADLLWDLAVDIALNDYGETVQGQMLVEPSIDLAKRAIDVRNSIIGLHFSTVLFYFVLGVCSFTGF